jgi:hypothetical protein
MRSDFPRGSMESNFPRGPMQPNPEQGSGPVPEPDHSFHTRDVFSEQQEEERILHERMVS